MSLRHAVDACKYPLLHIDVNGLLTCRGKHCVAFVNKKARPQEHLVQSRLAGEHLVIINLHHELVSDVVCLLKLAKLDQLRFCHDQARELRVLVALQLLLDDLAKVSRIGVHGGFQ